jgi:hypothetical protein
MRLSGAPYILWDDCFELMAEIRSNTALDLFNLYGETPYTTLLGNTPDISHLIEFAWYELIWYIDPAVKMENRKLGWYLGPSQHIGDIMCYKILTSKRQRINQSLVFPLNIDDQNNDLVKIKIK